MTRVIGVFPRQQLAGGLVDSLRNEGFDRKGMIISDIVKSEEARLWRIRK